jgi:rhamnosyltransferase
VDNGSTSAPESARQEVDNVRLILLPENRGIGSAQNMGAAVALEQGARFLVFLDQDSVPANDMVAQCLRTWHLLAQRNIAIGAVGALAVLRENSGAFIRFGWFRHHHDRPRGDEDWVDCDVLISSGTLVSAESFADIGPFEESFFIDKVDTEWCIRAASRGYRIAGAPRARLEHNLGDQSVRVWRGRWRHLPEHKPFRYYYMLRNAVLLSCRRYAPWRARSAIASDSLQMLVLFSIFPAQRRDNLHMMLKGLWDGVCRRGGPLR